jgi:hypothetical protein
MREVIERRPDWVAESTRVDSGTDPSPPSSTTGGPDPTPASPTTTGPKATTASSSTCWVLVRFGTDYHDDHWPDLLATLARRRRT